jgi:hypothetical protein
VAFVDRRLSREVEYIDPSVAVRADGSATSVTHAGVTGPRGENSGHDSRRLTQVGAPLLIGACIRHSGTTTFVTTRS